MSSVMNPNPKPMTNGDRIRAMIDEELAEIIMCPKEHITYLGVFACRKSETGCTACCLEWLKQPAEVE